MVQTRIPPSDLKCSHRVYPAEKILYLLLKFTFDLIQRTDKQFHLIRHRSPSWLSIGKVWNLEFRVTELGIGRYRCETILNDRHRSENLRAWGMAQRTA